MTAKEALEKIRVMLGVEEVKENTELETKVEEAVEIQLAEAELVDGTKVSVEGDFEVGKSLFVITDTGESVPAPQGSHETTDGNIVVVDENGIITSIENVTELESTDEVFNEDVVGKIIEGMKPMIEDLQNQINTLRGEFGEFKDEPASDRIKNNLNEFNKQKDNLLDTRMSKIMELRKNSYKK